MYKKYADKILLLEYENKGKEYNFNKTKLSIFNSRFGEEIVDSTNLNYVSNHIKEVCGSIPKCKECCIKKFCAYYREMCVSEDSRKYNVVDLFCGAGGFSLGFVQENFNIKFAVDNQQCCIDTYRYNHPEIPTNNIICKNIEDAKENMKTILRGCRVDIVIGGPPCQGFSMANRQRMIDDPRNKLYKQFVDSIEMLAPKFFVMENVEGILKIQDEIIEDFAKLQHSYKVISIKVNAADFGVPQNRKRVLFIGTRLDINLQLVINRIKKFAGESKRAVLSDALDGLREVSANNSKNTTMQDSETSGSIIEKVSQHGNNEYIARINLNQENKFVFNHKARYNNNRDIEIFSKLNPGDRADDPKIADIMPYTSRNDIFKDKYYRLQGDKISKTITAHMKYDGNMYIHPNQARGLTPREAARIQSYPDDYLFLGPYTKTYMQVGNSVPPLVSRTIAKVLKAELEKKKLR